MLIALVVLVAIGVFLLWRIFVEIVDIKIDLRERASEWEPFRLAVSTILRDICSAIEELHEDLSKLSK